MDNASSFADSFCGEYRVKHILIKPKISNNMSAEEQKKADDEAFALAKKLIVDLENGANWTNLVRNYSEEPISRLRDGLIQNFIRGYVDDALYAEVLLLPDGRFCRKPIKTPQGYHIVLRVKKNDSLANSELKKEENELEKINETVNVVNSIPVSTDIVYSDTSLGYGEEQAVSSSSNNDSLFSNIYNILNDNEIVNNPSNKPVNRGNSHIEMGANNTTASTPLDDEKNASEFQRTSIQHEEIKNPKIDTEEPEKPYDVSTESSHPKEDRNLKGDMNIEKLQISPESLHELVASQDGANHQSNYKNRSSQFQYPYQNLKDAQSLQSRVQRSIRFGLNNNRNSDTSLLGKVDNEIINKEYQSNEGSSSVTEEGSAEMEEVSSSSSESEGHLSGIVKLLLRRKYLLLIGVFLFLILIPLLFVMDKDGESRESKEKNDYLYSDGTEEDLYKFLRKSGFCKNDDECSSSQATKFYQKLKEVLNSNRNLTKYESEVFIMKFIQYERESEEVFEAVDEIEYIANIIGSSGKFSIDNTDKYEDVFTREDGYFMTYRKDLWNGQTENTQLTRAKIYNEIVKDSKNSIEKYELEEKEENVIIRSYCPGITVTGDLAGTYDIEEYIAKVISNENDWAPNGNLENNKAQAVAARTYALRRTNNCQNTIENSTRNQTMATVASNAATAATNEVAGQVLVDADGNYISTEYDAFCLDHSDDDNYYIVQKNVAIPKTWAHEKGIPTSYLTNKCGTEGDGGHGRGMSQWGSRYLSTQGYTYDQILYTFYDNATLKTLVSLSIGLETTNTGFIKRTSRALRDNAYFYNSEVSNEGECAWYAVRRTNEILANIGSATHVTRGGNGGDFCYASDYAQFDKVYDVNQLKPGMVISWSGGTYGHVAVIEDVHYDERGNIESVDISEGSINSGTGYNTVYDGHVLRDTYIWNLPEGLYKNKIRQYTCEGSLDGSTGTGCQSFVNVPINQIQTRWSSYKFICGIDLLS